MGIANSRPLTTKCPDIREPLTMKCTISHRDHPFISPFFFSFHYINEWCGFFFSNFYIHYTNVSRSFYHSDTFFLLLVQIAADMLSSSSSHRKYMKDRNVVL